LSTLKKAEPKFPQSIRLLNLHAQILFEKENNEELRLILERLLSLDPQNRMAISFLADYYQGKKNYTLADSLYRQGLKYYPEEPLLLNNFAYSLAVRNVELDSALSYINIALSKEPENSAYLDTKGWILYQKKEYKQAYEFIFKAYNKIKNDREVLEHLGDVLWKLENKEEAKKYWKLASEQDPEDKKLLEKLEKGL
ncbi:MAG: hypothetical protein KAR38_09295, partial [Calditrichia bacterium]|nr:hypothetical protein [Calditrichia bacterium]